MLVTLIAAFAGDRILGSDAGGIPWDHPRDRAHFRAFTKGKWLLVGRKTYAEMEGWFGERTSLVLTRDRSFRPHRPADRVVASPAEALGLADRSGARELLVCGGAKVYAALLPFAHRLVLTRIDLSVEPGGALRFPEFEASGEWSLEYAETWPTGEGGAPPARLEIYRRRG